MLIGEGYPSVQQHGLRAVLRRIVRSSNILRWGVLAAAAAGGVCFGAMWRSPSALACSCVAGPPEAYRLILLNEAGLASDTPDRVWPSNAVLTINTETGMTFTAPDDDASAVRRLEAEK